MNALIAELLNEEKWIIQNSITFNNGSVLLLEQNALKDTFSEIQILSNTNIDFLVKEGHEEFTSTNILKVIKESAITIFVGEGSYGSDGFIYILNNKDNDLIWYAFFDFSNPFTDAILFNDEIIATTNNGHKWHILLEKPQIINIEYL